MNGLCTDLYELRMAASYLRRGVVGPATFSLFVRDLPADRGFLVAAGLEDCLVFLEEFAVTDNDVAYLRDELGFAPAMVEVLRGVRFTGEVWAVPEGRVVFPGEPLLEVTAPIAEAQLVETALLNHVTFQTTVATKAARVRLAAGGADLIDFAFRRTQSIEAAMAVARTSAIAGFTATSNTEAARRFGLRAAGTMAHSFIEAYPDERTAFTAFATDFPQNVVLLVDTYDTLAGVRTAIEVVRELALPHPIGIRLDSGDLGALAVAARHMLDAAGLPEARIVASGSLDEYRIADLVGAGAPIDAYGVGTRMGVSADAPYLDSAYKLVAIADRPVMKLSAGKATAPGAKQVWRGSAAAGDLLALRDESPPPGRQPLLAPVMAGGQRIGHPGGVPAARTRFEADLAWLPEDVCQLRQPTTVTVHTSEQLSRLTEHLRRQLVAG